MLRWLILISVIGYPETRRLSLVSWDIALSTSKGRKTNVIAKKFPKHYVYAEIQKPNQRAVVN